MKGVRQPLLLLPQTACRAVDDDSSGRLPAPLVAALYHGLPTEANASMVAGEAEPLARQQPGRQQTAPMSAVGAALCGRPSVP